MLKISCLVLQLAGLIWLAQRARSCDPCEWCPHHPSLRFVLTQVYFDRPEGAWWGNVSTEVSERDRVAVQPGSDTSRHEPSRGAVWPKTALRRWQWHLCPVTTKTAHTCLVWLVAQWTLSKGWACINFQMPFCVAWKFFPLPQVCWGRHSPQIYHSSS